MQHFLSVDVLMFLAFFLSFFFFSSADYNGIAHCGLMKVLLNWKKYFGGIDQLHQLQFVLHNYLYFILDMTIKHTQFVSTGHSYIN